MTPDVAAGYRQHPVAILRYTYRFLFLLLVPLLRGVRYIATPQGLYRWVQGTWIDLLTVLLLLLLPWLEWRRHTYRLTEDGFHICRGILFRRESVIPRRHVTTLAVERPFFLRPLRAVRITIDTDAGSRRQADFRLTVGEKRARAILEQRRAAAPHPLYSYRPRWYSVVVLSLLASNSLSGIILLVTTFQQAGRQLGQTFQTWVLEDLKTVAGYMTVLPRTAAIIALVLAVGWGAAAVRNVLRYLPFRVTRTGGTLSIRTGLLVRRDYVCTVGSVNYVDYRQSLASKLLHLHMVFISCIGYGKGHSALSVLIPASPVKSSQEDVRHLLPEYRRRDVTLKAAPLSLYRYIFYPLWAMILLYPASRLLQRLFPSWQELIFYLTVMAYIPCAWQLTVKLIDRFTAGLARTDGFFILQYSRLYTYHTVLVPENKVVAYSLTQTFFQRLAHNCDVLVYTYNESHQYHRIKNIPLTKAAALFADKPLMKRDG